MSPRKLSLTPIKRDTPVTTPVLGRRLQLSLHKCTSTPTSTVSDCYETGAESGSLKFYSSPSSDKVWMQEAQNVIYRYSGVSLVQCQELVEQVPCSELLPHIGDQVIGDGACLFRAISKSITGTQDNHYALRLAVVNFMVHPDSVVAIGRFLCGSHIVSVDIAHDAVESYTTGSNMRDERTWGTEKELSVIASMFQATVNVFGTYPSKHNWQAYPPIRHCKVAMQPDHFMLYLYHVCEKNHYDVVIPKF